MKIFMALWRNEKWGEKNCTEHKKVLSQRDDRNYGNFCCFQQIKKLNEQYENKTSELSGGKNLILILLKIPIIILYRRL